MNRFTKKQHPFRRFGRILVSVLSGILLLFLFYTGLSSVSRVSSQEQEKTLKAALTRSITHYYAVNGCYPASLEELTDKYPIYYDTDQYFISYQPIAENIMPEIFIAKRDSGA
ncbi:MAG: hypothetical protein SOZ59_10005 [Candidatus Limivivens sp.]|nr:hypothetical protein [Candidatus Limivivens sp.]